MESHRRRSDSRSCCKRCIALWIALVVNGGAMFAIELSAAWEANSVFLLADAVDYLGDSDECIGDLRSDQCSETIVDGTSR